MNWNRLKSLQIPFSVWKYLDQQLSNVTVKASKTLAFLHQDFKIGSIKIKELESMAFLRPPPWIRQYCLGTPSTKEDTSRIKMTQRRAAHFVLRDYKITSSVDRTVCQLDWRSLGDRWQAASMAMNTVRCSRALYSIIRPQDQEQDTPRPFTTTTAAWTKDSFPSSHRRWRTPTPYSQKQSSTLSLNTFILRMSNIQ